MLGAAACGENPAQAAHAQHQVLVVGPAGVQYITLPLAGDWREQELAPLLCLLT